MPVQNSFDAFETRMKAAGVNPAAIRAFQHNYESLLGGATGMMPEETIQPAADLPKLEEVAQGSAGEEFLKQVVLIKLNGGLGTSMGLEKAKSLLPIKDGLTFLDFIARQVLHWRKTTGAHVSFMLMNSFSTAEDTREFLKSYPELGDTIELLQSQVPKVDATTLEPVTWPQNPQLEWCPPGHGDIYPSLFGSGILDQLLAQGLRYAFVSNSDNLGASLDPGLLRYFAESDQSFMMEVAERTEADRKGGHLARQGTRFVLRETAQCPECHLQMFQDVRRHRYFNTNNLWIRLDRLKDLLQAEGGFLRLPLIKNIKTVDPRQKDSPKVYQLETAMGAAIQCFENSGAVVVPRSRFSPVKTTSDLFVLRSDTYRTTPDWRLVLANDRGRVPVVELDPEKYKLVDQLDRLCDGAKISLQQCRRLQIQGAVQFQEPTRFEGEVRLENTQEQPQTLPGGTYKDQTVTL